MSEEPLVPEPQKLTPTHWLIFVIAAIGFAYDTYALLVMPIIARPALAALLQVDRDTASGNQEILRWTGYIMWGSALCGGVFGMLGGYLTDLFGRRRMLTWAILIYAVSAFASGFANDPYTFLILRCTTFIGVCLEFVAAVAWLAELFPNPEQRERILGYTQAFSSVGGLLVTAAYWVIVQFNDSLPTIYGEHMAWRYTLLSGVIPAIPLILVRPFLPESPAWKKKRLAGTLKRPSFAMLFQQKYRRTTLISAALFACAFGAAFGAIQMTPQMVPGLVPGLAPLAGLREAYEGSKDAEHLKKLQAKVKGLEEKVAKAQKEHPDAGSTKSVAKLLKRSETALTLAIPAVKDQDKHKELGTKVKELRDRQEKTIAGVQFWQEIGGLLGRFALAWLALRIVSRRKLLWLFQIPGLLIIPLVYFLPAAGNLPSNNLEILRVGMFFVGFFTVAQFSFWGNYLPRVFPLFLRGTGESFAANVGGRMAGTGANFLTTQLAVWILLAWPLLVRPTGIAYAAAAVALFVYLLGSILTAFLPEPKEGAIED